MPALKVELAVHNREDVKASLNLNHQLKASDGLGNGRYCDAWARHISILDNCCSTEYLKSHCDIADIACGQLQGTHNADEIT